MKSPPPPHSPSEADEKSRTPKKAWTKPTILRLEDGVVVTESGSNQNTSETAAYHPPS